MKYMIEKTDLGILVTGDIPLGDLAGLISTWENMDDGEEMIVSNEVARLMGASIAIAWNSQDLLKWVTSLRVKGNDTVVKLLEGEP